MRILRQIITGSLFTVALALFRVLPAFAQDYSCGTYGAGDFGEGDCEVAGDIANTGLDVWLLRALAAAVIVIAAYLIWRTVKKRQG